MSYEDKNRDHACHLVTSQSIGNTNDWLRVLLYSIEDIQLDANQ